MLQQKLFFPLWALRHLMHFMEKHIRVTLCRTGWKWTPAAHQVNGGAAWGPTDLHVILQVWAVKSLQSEQASELSSLGDSADPNGQTLYQLNLTWRDGGEGDER